MKNYIRFYRVIKEILYITVAGITIYSFITTGAHASDTIIMYGTMTIIAYFFTRWDKYEN